MTRYERARYLSVLEAYIHRKPILPRDIGGGPASMLDAVDISDQWFAFTLNCDKNCHTCSVCRDYYEQVIAKKGDVQ